MMHWLDSILSTDLSPVVESAFRSILLAFLVAGGLKLLRVRNVVAQKAAWILVLGSAFAMPLLAPLALRMPISAANAFHISWKRMVTSMPVIPPAASDAPVSTQGQVVKADQSDSAATTSLPYADAPADASASTHTIEPPQPGAQPAPVRPHLLLTRAQFLFLLYFGTCATLIFRLLCGAALAMRLWGTGQPVVLQNDAEFAHLSVRNSERISSPLTIGSGILLPADFAEWDAEKLRIVLAHEASHVRQRDFYLQLAAGLYSAIFWFIPLGWWLKRKLSDLSEAISDRAGLGEAANPASYAQILIHFAALPHNPQIGVAIARQGRLTQRIERLLNESSFHDAFSATRIRNAVAMLVVPVALFTATALVRVQAAQIAPAPVVAPPLAAPQQKPAAPAREPNPAAKPQDIPSSAPEQPAEPAAVELTSPIRLQIPAPLAISPDAQALIKAQTDKIRSNVLVAINTHALVAAQVQAQMARAMAKNGPLGYWLGSNNDPYSIVMRSADNGTVHIPKNRTWHDGTMEEYDAEIDKAKAVTHGNFIWFRRDGRSYVIDDPAILAQIKPMQDQIDALGKQQEALGKQQEALGKQQEELGKQMEQVKVPTPDMQKELAKLQAAQAKLAAVQGKDASQEQLSEIQSELAEVQGRIGAIQGDMGGRMGDLGGKMGALGGQQGELGAKQGRLGAEQGRLARELDGKVLGLIDNCLKSGKAKPVK